MTKDDSKDATPTPSKSDKRIIQVKLASEAAKENNSSEKSD